jgi:hypothetical protein
MTSPDAESHMRDVPRAEIERAAPAMFGASRESQG